MSDTKPAIIYHYTSLDSLISIVSSRTLRLCNAESMNDNVEISYSFSILKELIVEMHEKKKLNAEEFSGALTIFNNLEATFYNNSHIFMASFSMTGDTLSQWRAYANNGTGVCIGFNRDHLMDNLEGSDFKTIFNIGTSCIYEKQEIKEQLIPIIQDTFNTKIKLYDLVIRLLQVVCRGKHHAFAEERELRIVMGVDNKELSLDHINFSASNGYVKSFFTLNLAKPCIEEIILGPLNKLEVDDKSLKTLLRLAELEPEIKRSEATYR